MIHLVLEVFFLQNQHITTTALRIRGENILLSMNLDNKIN